jgi:hypothetical protein
VALLNQCNIPTILLNIYFCGDRFHGRECPEKPDGWRGIIDEEYSALGILDAMNNQDSFLFKHVKELFLPVDMEAF